MSPAKDFALRDLNQAASIHRPGWVSDDLFPFRSRFLDLDGARLHYVDEGSGPTLLFLPGSPMWSFMFRHSIKALRSRFRCISIDMPGLGLSTAPLFPGRAFASNAAYFQQFVRVMDLNEFTMIAHATGGLCVSTIVTHLCIDHLRSAKVRRELSTGVNLPEPLSPPSANPVEAGILAESLSFAFLAMLQSLSPVERAAFLLHEVFDFDYAEVARIIGKTALNCRQIVSRARKSLGSDKARFEIDPAEVRNVVERFVRAARTGDLDNLLELLAPDVVMYADGGARGARYGRVRNIARPLRGNRAVARFLINAQAQAPRSITLAIREVNLAPAIVTYVDRRPIGVMSFDVVDHRVRNIFIQADPEKLRGFETH